MDRGILIEISRTNPEASVASIIAIIQDEAERLGAKCEVSQAEEPLGWSTAIYVTKGNNHTAVHVSWASSQNLFRTSGTIGNGSLGYDLELELLVGEPPSLNGPNRPPFTWGVYPAGVGRVSKPPEYFLTADTLRGHVRERIQPN